MEKCIIFGASQSGENALRVLGRQFQILGFSDNDKKKWGQSFLGKKVYPPQELADREEKVKIIIASVYYASINKQLRGYGLTDIEVFYYMGSATDNRNSKDYKLYRISRETLFEKCIYDEETVRNIVDDFSNNYSVQERSIEGDIGTGCGRRQVLFCAYIFPPLGGAGVQRSLKFVKYLRRYGYEPVVLTVGRNDGKIAEDATMLAELPEDIRVIRIDFEEFLPECLSAEKQQEIFNLYCGVMQSKEWMREYQRIIETSDARMIPDNRMIWVNECLRQIESEIDLQDIKLVYTTGNPFSTYFLGYYLKKKYGMRWVQDYRDPWMTNQHYLDNYYQGDKLTHHLQRQLEKSLTQKADAIVTVEETFRKEYIMEFGISSERIFVITNGYDEDDFRGIGRKMHNPKFTLCHNGTVYIDRDPTKILSALNELIQERKISSSEIQWIFNGGVEKTWKEELDTQDEYHIIHYNGYLSHEKSISIAMNSNILVLLGISGGDSPTGCTGKVFEYIRMGKPILSLSCDRTSKEIIMKTQTGESFDYDNHAGIKQFILRHFEAWKKGDEKFKCNQREIAKYSRKVTTQKLAQIFDALLEE